MVLGATHPALVREQGERYRLSLDRMAKDLGIKKYVTFYNRFLELNELKEFIAVADLYLTPYLNPAQITSGTLAYAFGCGKAVVSTPYWHAEELLADGRGVLVPFRDSQTIAKSVIELLRDEPKRHAMRKRAYLLGREMIWSHVAHLYMESFRQARLSRPEPSVKRRAVPTLAEQRAALPEIRLEHLHSMTDSAGMFQHASYSIRNLAEGYCTDDNARALLLTVLLEELGRNSAELECLAIRYASFLNGAFCRTKQRFRNFLSFGRTWLEDVGSEDCQGRSLWALGTCIGRAGKRRLQSWAVEVFEQALPAVPETTSPRSWAFALLGIDEYFRRLSGDRLVSQVRDTLVGRLIELYEKNSSADWLWFEDILTYDNAKLSHALIASGRASGNAQALDIGIESLKWLMEQQTSPDGHFRPIGSQGWYRKGQDRAVFDQQPVDANASVSACLAAFRATEDVDWLKEAWNTFDWYLGRNDLGLEMYDPITGGCCDGLQQDRVNQNQGAEATLSYLLSLAELHLVDSSLAAFRSSYSSEARVGVERQSSSKLDEDAKLRVATHGS
jgi:hypothetical protein